MSFSCSSLSRISFASRLTGDRPVMGRQAEQSNRTAGSAGGDEPAEAATGSGTSYQHGAGGQVEQDLGGDLASQLLTFPVAAIDSASPPAPAMGEHEWMRQWSEEHPLLSI